MAAGAGARVAGAGGSDLATSRRRCRHWWLVQARTWPVQEDAGRDGMHGSHAGRRTTLGVHMEMS